MSLNRKPDLTLLHGLSADAAVKPEERGTRFRDGVVLAFDQSLNATGWVLMVFDGNRPGVIEAGVWDGTTVEAVGPEGTLQKGTLVFQRSLDILVKHPEAELAHESPPTGGKMARPESSLVSANSLRNAAHMYGRPFTMVSGQAAKKMICGDSNAKKAVAHRALKAKHGSMPNYGLLTNEHKRDAALVAMKHMEIV